MKQIFFSAILLICYCLLFPPKAYCQQKLSEQEEALQEKLVQLVLNFDSVEWEQLKTELRYKNFPVYSLGYEAIREAYFRTRRDESWVFSENDGPEVVENRFKNYEIKRQQLDWSSYIVGHYLEEIVQPRLKEDYKRLEILLDEYQPHIPDKNKLIFKLDKDRKVTQIYYSPQAKNHKPLPENIEKALLNYLQEKNYQTFETPELIHKPNIFWLKNKIKNIKWEIRQAFKKKKHYKHYE